MTMINDSVLIHGVNQTDRVVENKKKKNRKKTEEKKF